MYTIEPEEPLSILNSPIMSGLIATKIGMSRLFLADGQAIPVTYLKVAPNIVVRTKTVAKDGYNAIVQAAGAKPWKSRKGKDNVRYKTVKEWKIDESNNKDAGTLITCEMLPAQSKVSITGVSKGKGFQGVIKRHHFSSGPGGHGSHAHREGGSIGMRTSPGRVIPGKRMAGRMGSDTVTLKQREVVYCNPEEQVIAIKGPIPGGNGTTIFVTLESLPTVS